MQFWSENIIQKINNRIAIVTSSYHLSRSKEIFKFVYGKELIFWDVMSLQIIKTKELKS